MDDPVNDVPEEITLALQHLWNNGLLARYSLESNCITGGTSSVITTFKDGQQVEGIRNIYTITKNDKWMVSFLYFQLFINHEEVNVFDAADFVVKFYDIQSIDAQQKILTGCVELLNKSGLAARLRKRKLDEDIELEYSIFGLGNNKSPFRKERYFGIHIRGRLLITIVYINKKSRILLVTDDISEIAVKLLAHFDK